MSIQINANVSGFDPARHQPPRLYNDSPTVAAAAWAFDPGATRGHFTLQDHIPSNGWTLAWGDHVLRVWLTLTADHQPLAPGSYELALLVSDPGEPPMPGVLAYAPPTLPAITINGLDFVAAGQRWVYNGATHFLALERLLLGGEVVDYAGANVYRVFGTCVNISNQAGIPPLNPDVFSGYYDVLGQLADLLAARGTYLDFCCLADIQLLGKSVDWCRAFVANCAGVLGSKPNVLFDLGNEPWANGWRPDDFSRPGIPNVCSRGSIQDAGGEDGFDGPGVAWDVIRVHTRRDFPKMLTHCALPDPQYTYNKPIIVDEPFKLCDPTHGGYFDPRLARIAGDMGRAINGICFHTPGGVFSRALTAEEEACRAAFFGASL